MEVGECDDGEGSIDAKGTWAVHTVRAVETVKAGRCPRL